MRVLSATIALLLALTSSAVRAANAMSSAPLTHLPANFALAPLDGGAALDARTLKGKPMLVQMWASWCTSCAGVAGEIAAVRAEAGATVDWIAVSVDEDEAAALAAARKMVGVGSGGGGSENSFVPSTARRVVRDDSRQFVTTLAPLAVPTVLVVDSAGNVVQRVEGHFGAAQREALRAGLELVMQRR